ncbi:Hydroxyacylglutathione hydrolase [compost metagenome]
MLARFEEVSRWREQGRISLPSTMSLEMATNPFLRVSETSVKKIADERAGQENRTPEEVFAQVRQWKDRF